MAKHTLSSPLPSRWSWMFAIGLVLLGLVPATPATGQPADNELLLSRLVSSEAQTRPHKPRERWGKVADKVDGLLLTFRDRVQEELAVKDSRGDPSALSVDSVLRINTQGEIHCYIVLDTVDDDSLGRLKELGFRLELVAKEMRVAQGWIRSEAVDRIAALPFVRHIKPPDYAYTQCMGAFCSEGDTIHNADAVRTLGFDGSGVKIGVISNGVDHLADSVASGDLPVSGIIHPTLPGSGDEGTAMLEIVHDISPGADLFFAGPSTSAEMVVAIDWMLAQGVHVIVDDLLSLREPYFSDGPVATAARNAVLSNTTYVATAANYCKQHFQGMYMEAYPSGPIFANDFDAGPGVRDHLAVVVPPGERIIVWLQWNDPPGASSNDYDLRLIDPVVGFVGDGGQELQDGDDNPIELVTWDNLTGTTRIVGIVVQNFLGQAQPRTLELFCPDIDIQDVNANCEDAIVSQAAVPEVISCAAINASDLGGIAPYSSHGPSTIFFPSIEVRDTPFCTAIDEVQISGAGGFSSPFKGTSAAAPHAAGLAALLLDASDMAATPADIRKALAGGAVDQGDASFDRVTGHGLLDVHESLRYLPPLPPKSVAASRGTFCDAVQVSWEAASFATNYVVWRSLVNNRGQAIETGRTSATSYLDATVSDRQGYFYWVEAINKSDSTSHSDPATGFSGHPDVPTGVTATEGTVPDGIMLSWNEAEGAESYGIWRTEIDDQTTAVLIADVSETSYLDENAEPLKTYFYWVTAKNDCGESSFFSTDQGYRDVPPLAASEQVDSCGCGGGTAISASLSMLLMCAFRRRGRRRHERRRARQRYRRSAIRG